MSNEKSTKRLYSQSGVKSMYPYSGYSNIQYPAHTTWQQSYYRKDLVKSVRPQPRAPKEELRGVWVTTVRNTDFPSPEVFANGEFNLDLFKREFLEIISRSKALKINTIFFQVRPEGDAFYRSVVNPWSSYLTGEQGVEPNWGDFDPLAWMINAAHLEGIEFHAWFNPYRITPSDNPGQSKEELLERLNVSHYVRRHPDWVYFFHGQLYLDPGIPEVNDYMMATVREVLENYEVDAIHLDDFFYPYSYQKVVDGQVITVSFADESPDYETYQRNHQANQTIDEWREYNINHLVYSLSNEVRDFNAKENKNVAFGISPFGVWASAEETGGVGSQTSEFQLSSLSEYVNSKLWVESEWIDYIIPQNYWAFDDALSAFHHVADWWNQIVSGTKTQLYMGLGLYLYEEDASNPAWQNSEEINDQIRYLRKLENVKGYVFFTYHNLLPEKAETEVLKQALPKLSEEIQPNYSVVPPRPQLQYESTAPISNLKAFRCDEGCNLLTFEDYPEGKSQYYVIYRIEGSYPEGIDITNSNEIINVIGKAKGKKAQHYTDYQIKENQTYTYAVTALSQAQIESKPVFTIFMP